jgi:hypothetical protein
MTTLREAAQQAEAVLRGCLEHPDAADAIAALQAALAEPDAPQPKAEQRPPNCGTGFCSCIECPYVQPKAEPIAWGMPRSDGLIIDVICPDEHEIHEGQYTVPLYAHPYDQQALELCEECGWKTLIPDEGCLNCERQPKAEQEPFGYFHNPVLDGWTDCAETDEGAIALYAAPQPRKQLDVHEILDLMPEGVPARYDGELIAFCRAIEAAVWGDGK